MRSFSLALGLAAVLTGCTGASGPTGAPPRVVVELVRASNGAPTFDLAGPPTPATVTVRLGRPPRSLAANVFADVKSLSFALVAGPIDTSAAGATGLTPVGGLFGYDIPSEAVATGATLTFNSVPANAPGEAYHVVVAAFDGLAGTGANITNATGDDTATGRARLAGVAGPYYVSATSVRVVPISYALVPTTALVVALKLAD